jgi:hypothetical protein
MLPMMIVPLSRWFRTVQTCSAIVQVSTERQQAAKGQRERASAMEEITPDKTGR